MPYEEPQPAAEPAPKALSASLTVRATLATLVAFLATLAARRYGLDIPPEVQEAIVAIGVSVAAIGMRRAVAGWMLICALALPACESYPDLRPAFQKLDRPLAIALYDNSPEGAALIDSSTPAQRAELRASRAALYRQARATIAAGLGNAEGR